MSTKKIIWLWIGAFLALILIGIAAWGFRVATAPIKGQGDAAITKYSAENWTAAQARFEDLYADIEATDRKIEVAQASLDADPDDKTAQQTLLGTKNYCLEVVGDYNAEARKYLAEDFKASDLPAQINNNQQSTDCK